MAGWEEASGLILIIATSVLSFTEQSAEEKQIFILYMDIIYRYYPSVNIIFLP